MNSLSALVNIFTLELKSASVYVWISEAKKYHMAVLIHQGSTRESR